MIQGFRRADGRLGARNHVLALPSVVCASHVADSLASAGAVSLVHQHGCLHVGDDVAHTEQAFIGMALNPNVGGVVVVSLGCETIQGRKLASRIAEAGQEVEFVGIQVEGGTEATIRTGRLKTARLRSALDDHEPESGLESDIVLGVDAPDGALRRAIVDAAAARGLRWVVSERLCGASSHVELACAGAQVIVAIRGSGEAPIGFAICPVLVVATDEELYAGLHDDFDLAAFGSAVEEAPQIVDRAVAVFSGEGTASERRGARDFVLHRLAITM